MATRNGRFSWKLALVLLALCLVALALRLSQIESQSLWIDEGSSLCRAEQSLPALLSGHIDPATGCVVDAAPPVYYALLALVIRLAGDSVLTLRLLSVWSGVLSVPLVFVLGKRLFGRLAGFIAALLVSISPYWAWHSQAVRPNALFLLAVLLSLLALHRAATARQGHGRRLLLWVLATLLMLYIHPAALVVLVVELLALGVLLAARRVRWPALLAALVLLLAALPLWSMAADASTDLAAYRPAWYAARQLVPLDIHGPGPSLLVALRLLPTFFLLLASLAWLVVFPRRGRAWLLLAAIAALAVPVALLLDRAGSAQTAAQYVLLLIPVIYLLQGAGAAALWRRSRVLSLVAILAALAVSGLWLAQQVLTPVFSHEDLRAAARYASQYAQADDVIVLHEASIRPVWDYYYDGPAAVQVIPGPQTGDENAAIDRFQQAALRNRRVWFLRAPSPAGGFDPALLPAHAETQWVKFDQQLFSSAWLEVELDGYTLAPPVVEALPAGATPSDLCWPSGLCLRGWSTADLVPGDMAEVRLYWSQDRPSPDRFKVNLILRDGSGQSWTEYYEPILRYYPVPRWPDNQILEQVVRFPLSAAFPPTAFELAVEVQRQSDGRPVAAISGGPRSPLGTVLIHRPPRPLAADLVTLQIHNDAEFGGKLRLLGYNLPIDTPRPGHTTFIDFYWQVLDRPAENWLQRTRWVDRDGRVWVEQLNALSLPEFDMLQWQVGDLVQGHIFFPVPGPMPAGEYKLEVMLLSADDAPVPATEIWRAEPTDTVVVGPAYLDSWPFLSEPPAMPNRPDAVFGGTIRLWGYGIRGTGRPGDELAVTLVWRDELPLERDYHVFVHLMDESGALLAQADGAPVDWTRPTTSWRPGEYLVDAYTLPALPAESAGVAYLWVGLYDPAGSGRLPVQSPVASQEPDRFLLDVIVIEP